VQSVNQDLAKENKVKISNKKYTLGSRLLSSTTGDVYAAWSADKAEPDDMYQPPFFIQFLPENYPRSAESMQVFSQEVERAKVGCKTFNIVAFEQTGDHAYLVFELPNGEFLSNKILQKAVYGDLSDVLSLAEKIKKAFENVKNCGLVHGCVGLDSIYITKSGEVILVDSIYISAKQHQLEKDIEHTTTIPNREAIYASPDVCFGREVSEQDDVFSLACISYHLLSGRHPFAGENSVAILLNKTRPQQIDSLTDAQWQHLENGMSLVKESRLETVDDFIKGFDNAALITVKSSISESVNKVKKNVLAKKHIKSPLNKHEQQKKPVRSSGINSYKEKHKVVINVPPQKNKMFSFEGLQASFHEWSWIPLSLLAGILSGAIIAGLVIEIFGVNIFSLMSFF